MIDKKRVESFNCQAKLYDSIRPGYPSEMYKDIQTVCNITHESTILEIGTGSGIATCEMAIHWAALIVGVEPGRNLYAIAIEKCRGLSNINIVNQRFEEYKPEIKFDVIISASSFHWIDPAIKYTKCANLLKENGHLAVFWNNFSRDDSEIFNTYQRLYDTHFHDSPIKGKDIREFRQEKIQERTKEIRKSRWFSLVFHNVYRRYHKFNASGFIALLKTYSRHAVRQQDALKSFYDEVHSIILENENEIQVPIDVSLDIGKKIDGNEEEQNTKAQNEEEISRKSRKNREKNGAYS